MTKPKKFVPTKLRRPPPSEANGDTAKCSGSFAVAAAARRVESARRPEPSASRVAAEPFARLVRRRCPRDVSAGPLRTASVRGTAVRRKCRRRRDVPANPVTRRGADDPQTSAHGDGRDQNGDELHVDGRSIIVCLGGRRTILSRRSNC